MRNVVQIVQKSKSSEVMSRRPSAADKRIIENNRNNKMRRSVGGSSFDRFDEFKISKNQY